MTTDSWKVVKKMYERSQIPFAQWRGVGGETQHNSLEIIC